MFKKVFLIFVTFLVFGCATFNGSIEGLVIPKKDKDLGSGCSFLYHGYEVTAAHVPTEEHLYVDKERDLKIIRKVEKIGFERAQKEAAYGEIITSLYAHRRAVRSEDDGTVVDVKITLIPIPGFFIGRDPIFFEDHETVERYIAALSTYGGFSGSPVLNKKGRILGVGIGYLPSAVNNYFHINSTSLLIHYISINELDTVIDRYEERKLIERK